MSQSYSSTAPPSFIQMVDLEKGQATLSRENLINPMRYNYPPAPKPTAIANPGPLGLFSFASTTLVLSLINTQARGVTTPNVVCGMAIFVGGLVQLLAGMWEFPKGNVFGATAFTSYGAFWMSYATILIPGSGIVDAYAKSPPEELTNALGIYLIAWGVFTFLMMIATLRKNAAFLLLFACLTITFVLLAIGMFAVKVSFAKAGGTLGIITALVAYYCAMSELLSQDGSTPLPLGNFGKRS